MDPISGPTLVGSSPNIRPGLQCMVVANTLAYYDTATFMVVKSLIVQDLVVCTIKLFTAVIVAVSSKPNTVIDIQHCLLLPGKARSLPIEWIP